MLTLHTQAQVGGLVEAVHTHGGGGVEVLASRLRARRKILVEDRVRALYYYKRSRNSKWITHAWLIVLAKSRRGFRLLFCCDCEDTTLHVIWGAAPQFVLKSNQLTYGGINNDL